MPPVRLCSPVASGAMATNAERRLAEVRTLVRRKISPLRHRLAALGVANLIVDWRLSDEQREECLILMERLLAENARLIHMLGIAEFVGVEEPTKTRPLQASVRPADSEENDSPDPLRNELARCPPGD